jgi:hypothetical protein
MMFWLHLEIAPEGPLASLVSAGYEQAAHSAPKFGTDTGAFGERLGTSFIRDASMRFFVSILFPVLLHEDPRYYRMAWRGPIVRPGIWAGGQALVTHTDRGRLTVNYSDLLGHLAACALTPFYYPARSANGGVVMEAWTSSVVGDAGNNLLLEFVPSIVTNWRRRRFRRRAENWSHKCSTAGSRPSATRQRSGSQDTCRSRGPLYEISFESFARRRGSSIP